ncbi:MAG: NAD(P)-dependent oxidoreductase [Candidatus Sumerlaeota bacterium]
MAENNALDKSAKIGFIGLGWMGSNFAKRLVEGGWSLEVFDIDAGRVDALDGAEGANCAEEIVGNCQVVLTSLPNSDVFEAVVRDQLIPNARREQLFVDLGTSRLEPTRGFAREMGERGASLLDAPVSGDPRQPVYMFVGGERDAFERVRPVLETIADPAHLTLGGESGAGQVLKAVNQLAMGLVQAAWLETLSFATCQGVDADRVGEAVGGEGGWRRTLREVAGRIAAGEAEGMDLKFAELPYFLDAAKQAEMDLPLTEALYEYCKPGPRNWRDNMNRPYVSFWHMLERGGCSG